MAAKIKDGLFIGDLETSQDVEFLELNKISNLVNLAGKECPNVWTAHGLVYLTLNWEDHPDFTLFPDKERNDILDDLCEFVDVSLHHGISVLLFSTKGLSRCVVAAITYLMCKYCWGVDKSLEFVRSKKPDLDINRGFLNQLYALEKRLQKKRVALYGTLYTDFEESIKIRHREWTLSYLDYPNLAAVFSGELDLKEPSFQKQLNRLDKHVASRIQQVVFQHSNSKKRRGGVGIYSSADEEALLINSYLNSKQTITELPGPFLNVYKEPKKSFKLRFHHQEREYESETTRNTKILPQSAVIGVLKGTRSARMQLERESDMKQAHASKNSHQHKHHAVKSANSNHVPMSVGERGCFDDNSEFEIDEYARDERSNIDNSDAMSDVSDPLTPVKGGDNYGYRSSNRADYSNNKSNPVSQNQNGRNAPNAPPSTRPYRTVTAQPIQKGSAGRLPSPSRGVEDFGGSLVSNTSTGSDLYSFVGLGPPTNASVSGSVMSMHSFASNEGEMRSSSGGRYASVSSTAPSRNPVPQPVSTRSFRPPSPNPNDKLSRSQPVDLPSNTRVDPGVQNKWSDAKAPVENNHTLTLHDIATMSIDPTPIFRNAVNSGPSSSTNQAASAGMSKYQSGGPLRIVSTLQQSRTAWNEDQIPNSAAPSSAPIRASTPTRGVPGKQLDELQDQPQSGRYVSASQAPSYMQPKQQPQARKMVSSSSNSSMNSVEDEYYYSAQGLAKIPGTSPRQSGSLKGLSSGTSAPAEPRLYRYGSPAPNKARQAPAAAAPVARNSSSRQQQPPFPASNRPSSASRAQDNPYEFAASERPSSASRSLRPPSPSPRGTVQDPPAIPSGYVRSASPMKSSSGIGFSGNKASTMNDGYSYQSGGYNSIGGTDRNMLSTAEYMSSRPSRASTPTRGQPAWR